MIQITMCLFELIKHKLVFGKGNAYYPENHPRNFVHNNGFI